MNQLSHLPRGVSGEVCKRTKLPAVSLSMKTLKAVVWTFAWFMCTMFGSTLSAATGADGENRGIRVWIVGLDGIEDQKLSHPYHRFLLSHMKEPVHFKQRRASAISAALREESTESRNSRSISFASSIEDATDIVFVNPTVSPLTTMDHARMDHNPTVSPWVISTEGMIGTHVVYFNKVDFFQSTLSTIERTFETKKLYELSKNHWNIGGNTNIFTSYEKSNHLLKSIPIFRIRRKNALPGSLSGSSMNYPIYNIFENCANQAENFTISRIINLIVFKDEKGTLLKQLENDYDFYRASLSFDMGKLGLLDPLNYCHYFNSRGVGKTTAIQCKAKNNTKKYLSASFLMKINRECQRVLAIPTVNMMDIN